MSGENLDASLQLDVPAALRDTDANRAIGLLPTLADDVPVGEIVLGDGDLGLLRLSRLQCHISEALESLWGLSRRGWEFQVQLWRLIRKGQENCSGSPPVRDPLNPPQFRLHLRCSERQM